MGSSNFWCWRCIWSYDCSSCCSCWGNNPDDVGCFFVFVFHHCFCTVAIRYLFDLWLEISPVVFFTSLYEVFLLFLSVGLCYWHVTKWILSCAVCSLLVDFMLFHDWLELLHRHHMLSAEELDGKELGCCWMVSLVLLLVQLLPRKQLKPINPSCSMEPSFLLEFSSSTIWPNKIVLM